ncbi:von Willebrand factor A domain-containing protein 2-like [Ciona intestinalis]
MKGLFLFNLACVLICGTSGEYCLKMGNITNGNVACSEGNMVGSVCSFTCNEVDGYKLFPLTLTSSTCLNNREWDEGRPCCARGCPRYAVMDLVIVLDSSSSVGQQNWEIMKSFVREIINTFEVSSTATRIAVFRYNKEIDTTSQILLSDFPDDKQALLRKYNAIPYDGSGTKTGQALSHVLNVVLSPANGNRPDVKDVILTITDGRSFDDVSQPSLQLRNQGALTYVLGILPSNGLGLDDEQLDVIAGSSERSLVADAGFSGLNQDFAARIGQQICGKPCAITCQPHPSQPMNGYVSCTDRNVVGSKCNFRCKEGFALVGAANMTCDDDLDGDDGVWSAVAPTCQQITCNPVQESPVNGDMTCTKTNLVGSICFFACDQGYELVGATDSVCNEVNGAVDGTWTNLAPRCERKVCPEAPVAPIFGTRTCTDEFNLNSQCEYTCNKNYIRSGARYSTCVEDINGVRTFDNDAPTCTPTKCLAAAPAPVNGFKICSNENEFGSVCEYGCNIGYRSIGPLIAVCGRTADGTLRFNDTAPICQAIQCPQQSEILNGQVSCTDSNTYDSTCTFQCDQSNGYSLYPSGHSRTTCLSNSSWSWTSPCCSRPCLKHSVIDMIFILDSSSSVGSVNWDVMKNFVRDVINLLSITETGTRVSIFRYNRRPDRQSQILLNDHIGDEQGLLSALDQMPYNGRGTMTGQALQYVNDTILADVAGNRPEAVDVVLTVTDGRSVDDVAAISDSLRQRGALTYAIGVIPPNKKGADRDQLLSIAGEADNIFLAINNFDGVYEKFIGKLDEDLCG